MLNNQFSKNLIKNTFEKSFDKDLFIYFVKNLLNNIKEAPFIYRGNFIPDSYKFHIKTLERIGKYQDEDDKKIDLLIVHLKKETSLEQARTMQRNFIAWYLNGSRGDVFKDAALVAFVSPGGNEWRFSLVKMEYQFDKNGKVKKELTPARRYSFLVGKNESSHTAQNTFVNILENDINPTLSEIEKAFNVEKVTKEFFGEYKKLFEMLGKELKSNYTFQIEAVKNNINTVNFAKKLLGQIAKLRGDGSLLP